MTVQRWDQIADTKWGHHLKRHSLVTHKCTSTHKQQLQEGYTTGSALNGYYRNCCTMQSWTKLRRAFPYVRTYVHIHTYVRKYLHSSVDV